MKPNLFIISILFIASSCSNEIIIDPALNRTNVFQLYTKQDFSTLKDTIRFSVFIKDGSKAILDSSLKPMRILDIPSTNNKITVSKTIPNTFTSDLRVGFNYTIDNVGNSWHLELLKADDKSKIIDVAFE